MLSPELYQEKLMNHRKAKTITAWASAGWLWLLVACTPGTSIEPGDNPQPADAPATSAAPVEEQTDAKPDDIVDRIFEPLDDAVSDINRDINKNDADNPSGPDD